MIIKKSLPAEIATLDKFDAPSTFIGYSTLKAEEPSLSDIDYGIVQKGRQLVCQLIFFFKNVNNFRVVFMNKQVSVLTPAIHKP